jgi:predicted metal-binding membrane protein
MTQLRLARRHPEIVLGLLALAALAWWWTVQRMAGMGAAPGTGLGSLGWFTGSWAAMMAAMMLPSLAPTLSAYAAAVSRRPAPDRWLLFAAGYLLVWTAVGVCAYGGFELGRSLLGSTLAWNRDGRWASAGVLAIAATYQLTPMKQACLSRCRGQLTAAAPSSPAIMGLRAGGWCVGCSWALMVALFALGVMSITWMVVIAALVALEKTGPWRSSAPLVTAGVLALLALGILVAPHDVPGLVVPGSPAAMHGMVNMS